MSRGFTLIEIIVVIIIVGILAAVGLSQYSLTVEKTRLAEAKIRIGNMRQLAHEYYLNNGNLTGLLEIHVGVEDESCHSTGFYKYFIGSQGATYANLVAQRCTSGGKSPNTSRVYLFYMSYYPATGQSAWHCYYYDDISPCFGYPA